MLEIFGSNKSRIVIFVHGFNSNPETFLNDNGRHFFQSLRENETIDEHFDWGQFSYETNIFRKSLFYRVFHLFRASSRPVMNSQSLDILAEHFQSEIESACKTIR